LVIADQVGQGPKLIEETIS